MDVWTLTWIAWLLFLAIADVVANRKDQATFSEHMRRYFKSAFSRVILATFLVCLYLHFVIDWPVWPVILFGSGIGFYFGVGVKRES